MTNRFTITISSVDRATAGIRRIKENISRIFRPVTRLRQSLGKLGQELGLPKALAGIKKVAAGIGAIVTPLNALLGAGTLAGLGRLAAAWGEIGFNASRSARTIGITTKQLQEARGAAQLAHIDPGAAESNISTFAENLQNARYGRDPALVDFMRFNNVKFRQTADGRIDTMAMLRDVARLIQQQDDPQKQLLIANRFGLQDLLPILRDGPDAYDKLADAARRAGVVMTEGGVKSAEKFTQSLDRLTTKISGMWQELAEAAAPRATRLMDWASNAIEEETKKAESGAYDKESFMDYVDRVVGAPFRWGAEFGKREPRGPRRLYSGRVVDERPATPAKKIEATDAWEWNEHGQRVRVADQPDRVRIFQDEYDRTTNPRDREALLREMQRMGIAPRGQQAEQKVVVDVNLRNAPAGTTATATSDSGAPVSARVHHSMTGSR